jgi:polar amino acid transport system permease protein
VTAPTTPRASSAPPASTPKAIPVRHYGQWVAAVVVVVLLVLLVRAVAANQVIQWDVIGSRIFRKAILEGLVTTISSACSGECCWRSCGCRRTRC